MNRTDNRQIERGTALCLSGGGYRALLFHLGGMWRLNELGWLPRLKHVVGVSGGAVTATWLGLKYRELDYSADGIAGNFHELIARPLIEHCSRPMDIVKGLMGFATKESLLPGAYDRMLYHGATLGDLPQAADGPRISVMCTNLLVGSYTQFTRDGITDEYLGFCPYPELPVARAVGASCSLPPTFKPVKIACDPAKWQGEVGEKLKRVRNRRVPLRLCDGGNYDNLGLCLVWDDYESVLVSDGSSPMPPWGWLSTDWVTSSLRSNRILIDQLRRERKRLLMQHKYSDERCPQTGAYWGIASKVAKYPLADPLVTDTELTSRLANMRTRLGRHTPEEIGQLVNFGYAMCDTAVRSHLRPGISRGEWPVPEHGL